MIPDNIPFKELDGIIASYIAKNPANTDVITGLLEYIAEYYEKNDSVRVVRGEELFEVMFDHFRDEYHNEI